MNELLESASERTRKMVIPAVQAALDRLHPDTARIAAYHLGWIGHDGHPVADAGGGKMLRSTLALLSAEAAGADPADGVPGAVAIELVHNFSLLHDDIMDSDRTRRGRPAAWTSYGIGPAILTGDALLTLAISILVEDPGAGTEAARRLAAATACLAVGQAADLAFEQRPYQGPEAVTEKEYLTMSGDKTGALFAVAACIGAVLADAPAHMTDALHRAGHHLGLAFQAVDDLLGIWGAPTVTGKPLYGDLRRGKKTFPIITALATGTPDSRRLADLLEAGPRGDDDLERAARLIEAAGGRSHTRDLARTHLDRALRIIGTAGVPTRVAAEFTALVQAVTDGNR